MKTQEFNEFINNSNLDKDSKKEFVTLLSLLNEGFSKNMMKRSYLKMI